MKAILLKSHLAVLPLLLLLSGCFENPEISNVDSDTHTNQNSSTTTRTDVLIETDTATSTNEMTSTTVATSTIIETNTAEETTTSEETSTSTSTDDQTPTQTETTTQTDEQTDLTELELAGQSKYAQLCAVCHSDKGDGANNNTSSILQAIIDETAIDDTFSRMPLRSPTSCDYDCAKEVIAWVAKVNGLIVEIDPEDNSEPVSFDLIKFNSEQTYRQASILLGSGIPTQQDLENSKNLDSDQLRQKIISLMSGDGFKAFLKNSANDRLLVRSVAIGDVRFVYENWYQEYEAQFAQKEDADALGVELREQPLELINYVVQNDRPYIEILTADYVLASKQLAVLYQSSQMPEEGQWVKTQNNGQYIMSEPNNNNKRPSKNWDYAVKTQIPEAGILSSMAYLIQNPSTATNRNRARSRWTMYHFLGYDIEASAPRVKIEDADDSDNPTLNNSACVVCHKTMDPIAAGFQDFGFLGLYKDGKQGKHALSFDYALSDLYEDGHLWYSDVLPAGFNNEIKPESEVAIQWLAKQITQDPRFATATIKFWWPAIYGKEFYETQSQTELEKQLEFSEITAQNFIDSNYDLKVLLADLLMSDWYLTRNIQMQGESEESDLAPISYNGQRLLTPEELQIKQTQIFSVDGEYMNKHYLSYGGIDSTETTVRDRNMNVVKLNVLKANAFKDFCSVAYQDFIKPKNQRTLFSNVELNTLPGLAISTESRISNSELTYTRYKANITNDADVVIHIKLGQGDVRLRKMKIADSDGVVLFNGNVNNLESNEQFTVEKSIENVDDDFRFKNTNKFLTITLPQSNVKNGLYKIDTYHLPHVDLNDASLFVEIYSTANSKEINDNQSVLIKEQIQNLYELITGEMYGVNHEEIELAYELFHQFRDNAVQRESTSLIGDDYLCIGEGTKNGFDRYYTFAAWKGLIMTLATDYSFAAE